MTLHGQDNIYHFHQQAQDPELLRTAILECCYAHKIEVTSLQSSNTKHSTLMGTYENIPFRIFPNRPGQTYFLYCGQHYVGCTPNFHTLVQALHTLHINGQLGLITSPTA